MIERRYIGIQAIFHLRNCEYYVLFFFSYFNKRKEQFLSVIYFIIDQFVYVFQCCIRIIYYMMGTSLTPDTRIKHILSYPEYLYQKEEYSYAFLK